MKYSELIKLKNGGLMEIDEKAFSVGRVGAAASSQISSFGISGSVNAKAAQLLGAVVLKLNKAEAGTGMWVPYLAGRTVYGYLSGSQTWASSGPFSGCYLEVGSNNQQIYVAHISCESKDDANVEAWKSVLPGRTVLFSAKISMSRNLPPNTMNAAAITFVSVTGSVIEVTRVDVKTASTGGMSGQVFDVQLVANGSS